jgi:flagellar hook capping protein FlgD
MLTRWGPPAVVLALLVATATAFVVTERLKLERSPVQRTMVTPTFSPGCECATPDARISFRLRRPQRLSVDIVDSGGDAVRILLVPERLERGTHRFVWNGRDENGAVAADGSYRVRLRLEQGRTITVPNPITLDTRPPVVESAGPARPDVFSPDGDGRSDRIRVEYTLSEPAHALLYVGGRLVVRSHSKERSGHLFWYGRSAGRLFAPRAYPVFLGARDLAGNLGVAKPAGTVRLRYVALSHRVLRARPRGRLVVSVSTDAKQVAWRLAGRGGLGGRVLRLRAPRAPGRYRLVVSVGGHRARALVLVRGSR